MLRITNEPDADGHTVRLRLEGRLTGPWVEELRRVCAGLSPSAERRRAFVLDLAEVSFVDVAGMALVRALAREGVFFANPSAFVAEQLKEVSDVEG